jgi:hypothetical protein
MTDPQEIVQSIGNSRTEVAGGTGPFKAEDAVHDGLCQSYESLLVFEIYDCFVMQYLEVRVELGVTACKDVEVYEKIVY